MCGISGLIVRNNVEDISDTLLRMNNRIKHRGPDDEGYLFFDGENCLTAYGTDTANKDVEPSYLYSPNASIETVHSKKVKFGFGHRRLAIIDLTAGGHQPMGLKAEQELWITCNGELYNYIELREELQNLGYKFHSNSDIEVILQAYNCWGTECVNKFNGMWAFVIFDKTKNILFGSRDRFGVKPLYYTINKQHFAFASEHKAILEIPSYVKKINEKAVFRHLLYGEVEMEPESFFKGIFELLPAHNFFYDLSKDVFTVQRYYSLTTNKKLTEFNQNEFDEAVDKTRDLIENAIKLRFRSDVPIGFCLSGGLDSSTIVCFADKLNKMSKIDQLYGQVKTFTAGSNSKFDESAWAEKIVQYTNSKWCNTVVTSESLIEDLSAIIYHQDIPLYSTSTYAQNRVMKAASEEGVTILLDGQGGDEIFAGYPTFYTAYLNSLFKKGKFRLFFKELFNLSKSPTSIKIYCISLLKITLERLPIRMKHYLSLAIKSEFSLVSKTRRSKVKYDIHLSGDFSNKSMNELLVEYCTGTYLKNLLRWEDRCSMQYSIESRTPFSDDIQLIEYVFSLPPSYKIHDGWSKYLLRSSIKGIVPEEIRLRTDKKGYSIPQNEWLVQRKDKLFKIFKELKYLDKLAFLNQKKIEMKWDIIFSDAVKNQKKQNLIFRYVCYLIWLDLFFNNNLNEIDG